MVHGLVESKVEKMHLPYAVFCQCPGNLLKIKTYTN